MLILDPRPENKLLTLIARRDLDDATADSIKRLLTNGGLDWEYISTTASAHGLIALLATHVQNVGPDTVPKSVLRRLQAENQQNTEYSLWLTGELIKLAAALRTAGIPFITFKGPTLSVLAYGDIGLRQFTDLDLFVDRKDVREVKRVLGQHAFTPVRKLTSATEAALLRFDNALAFTNEQDVLIDMHWRFTAPYLSLELETAELWRRVEYIDLGQPPMPTLSAEDLILVSCVHGFTHHWERLIWACDVATLMRRDNLDWNYLIASARRLGMLRILLAGLAVASELGALLPKELDEQSRTEVQQFKNAFLNFEGSEERGSGWLAHQLRMRERWPDKLTTLARLAFTPRDYDCMYAAVAPSLSFLYYLVRPVRMIRAYARRVLTGRAA